VTWSRFDDRWADRPVWESVDLASRWHYLCLIQSCSRNERYDGIVPLKLARRASDVDDPDECHAVLEAHSLLEIRGDEIRIVEIDEHVPPPSIRNNAEASKVRMARMRKHKNGDHSDCLSESCPQVPVTGFVTRNTGTGQDGQLPEEQPTEEAESVTRNGVGNASSNGVTSVWPEAVRPGSGGAR
jgi:hypothetical protein